MAGCKGWKVEDGENGDWDLGQEMEEEEEEGVGADGRPMSFGTERIEVVRMLERNWARFMGLIDDTR